jgi:hypothetical protein
MFAISYVLFKYQTIFSFKSHKNTRIFVPYLIMSSKETSYMLVLTLNTQNIIILHVFNGRVLKLAVECDYWVCTLSSNWCVLIDELRSVSAGKAHRPYVDIGFPCFQGC